MSDEKKNNIFLFSPGGYGPHSRIHFWADRVEPEYNEDDASDGWFNAAHDYTTQQDVDYGCSFMSRKEAEKLLEDLKKLLEE